MAGGWACRANGAIPVPRQATAQFSSGEPKLLGREGWPSSLAPNGMIKAKQSGSRGREIKQQEAVDDRKLAAISDRPESMGKMDDEEGDGHLAGENERDDASKKFDQD